MISVTGFPIPRSMKASNKL